MSINERAVLIDYTNWRGERGTRRIYPLGMFFGSNEWHPEPQWMIEAMDMEKNARRTFALSGIHSWSPSPEPTADSGREAKS